MRSWPRSLFSGILFLLLLLQGALCSYAAEAETGTDKKIAEAEALITAWRVEDAAAIIPELLRENPESPDVLDLSAMLAYYQGDYPQALENLSKALEIDSSSEQRHALNLLLQQTHDNTKNFKRFESDHFVLFLDEAKDGILAKPALEALEKAHKEVGRELGYLPKSKVRVEIAPDVVSFNAISTLSLRDIEETGAIGLCKFNKVMIISPRVLAHGYRWLDSLTHEYIHFAIVNLTGNKAPIWLHEGIARYYETLWRNPGTQSKPDYLTPANETLLARATASQKFISFKEMEPSLIRLETPEQVQLAYAEAASAVDYVKRAKGPTGVRDVLSGVAERSTPEAIETVMGVAFDEFEGNWRNFLAGQDLKEVDGSSVRKYKVIKDGAAEDEEIVDLREIESEVARNRTHLADRLLQRGRDRAAIAEYQRALRAGPNSTIILNKLGEALVNARAYDRALPHLEKARYLSPDRVQVYFLLGRLYYGAGNYPEALRVLDEALEINPFHPGVYQLLGQIYDAQGNEAHMKEIQETLRKLRG